MQYRFIKIIQHKLNKKLTWQASSQSYCLFNAWMKSPTTTGWCRPTPSVFAAIFPQTNTGAPLIGEAGGKVSIRPEKAQLELQLEV